MATSEFPKVALMTVWRTDWNGECLETTWRALSINNKWGAPLRPCQWDTRAPDLLERYRWPNFTQGNWGSEKLIICPVSWESQWRNLNLWSCVLTAHTEAPSEPFRPPSQPTLLSPCVFACYPVVLQSYQMCGIIWYLSSSFSAFFLTQSWRIFINRIFVKTLLVDSPSLLENTFFVLMETGHSVTC